jgi:hypothetical protein
MFSANLCVVLCFLCFCFLSSEAAARSNICDFYSHLIAMVKHAEDEGFIKEKGRLQVLFCSLGC